MKKTAGKRKITIEYKTNEADRKNYFRKRAPGLYKKAWELAQLTGALVKIEVYFPELNQHYQFNSSEGLNFKTLPPQMRKVVMSNSRKKPQPPLPEPAQQAQFSCPESPLPLTIPSPCSTESDLTDVDSVSGELFLDDDGGEQVTMGDVQAAFHVNDVQAADGKLDRLLGDVEFPEEFMNGIFPVIEYGNFGNESLNEDQNFDVNQWVEDVLCW